MTTDDIHLNNFTESLKLSQKMFNLGLLLSSLAIFFAFNPDDAAGQAKIPFLDIRIESRESFVAITASLFLLIGFYMNFAIKRCCTTLSLIKNEEVAEAAKGYPSIVNATFSYTVTMVVALAGLWAATMIETYKMDLLHAVVVSQVMITPYIYGARKSKKITPVNG